MRPAAFVSLLALGGASLSFPAKAPDAALPGPGRGEDPGRVARVALVNAACEGCHAEIAAEWRSSLHQTSFTDPAFQRALAMEDAPFCRGCHAPEAKAKEAPPPALAALGVACTTCHLAGQTVIAAPGRDEQKAPHAVVRSADFAASGACAGCHEFDFPDASARPSPEKMQLTITEHASSPYSEVSCAGCHMPLATGASGKHRSHSFASSRAEGAQARALAIVAARSGDTVSVTIGPGEVGHAFPTGDLFRRLAVVAEVVDGSGALVARKTRWLGRHYRPTRLPNGQSARVTAADDRPGAPALEGKRLLVPFSFGKAAEGRAIVVRVDYERVLVVPDAHEDLAEVESFTKVFESVLPPEGPQNGGREG